MGPGRDKLLEPVDGEPLLRRQARTALAAGCPVLVTLPPDRPRRAAALAGLPLQQRELTDAAGGMSASLRCGADMALTQGAGLMVLPADMPDLTTTDLMQLAQAFHSAPGLIHRGAAQDGRPGHPVIFPPALLQALTRLSGDQGARGVLQAHSALQRLHPLPGEHALTDLDTPEAWEAWRAQQKTGGAASAGS